MQRANVLGPELLECRRVLSADVASGALASYVTALYHDLLARPVDAASLAFWTRQIEQGEPISRVAATIAHSREYYSTLIAGDYRTILGRPVDADGLSYWLACCEAGMPDAQLEAELASTDEFYDRVGGSDGAYLHGVYETLLSRRPESAAQDYWLGRLQAGASRSDISRDLAFSDERAGLRIEQDYAEVLHLVPDDPGVEYWAQQIAAGVSNEDLQARFASSHEYFKQQTGQPITIVPMAPDDHVWRNELAAIDSQAAVSNPAVLFVGDSLTANWTVGAGLPIWNQVFAPLGAMQAGVHGDETQGLLWRLDHSQLAALQPKLVVLMIGTNNLTEGDSPADVAAGIQAVVARLRAIYPNAHLALMGVLPRGATADDPLRRAAAETNLLIEGLADGQRVTYVDLWPGLLNPDGTVWPGTMLPGLIHLDLRGYAVWASALGPELKAVFG